MLNYIILGIVKYLQAGPWGPDLNADGYPKIPMFDQAALLPKALGSPHRLDHRTGHHGADVRLSQVQQAGL